MPRLDPLRTLIVAFACLVCTTGALAAATHEAKVFLGETLVTATPDGQVIVAIDSVDSDDLDLVDVVFRYLPDDSADAIVGPMEWRGPAQTTYRAGGLLVVGVDDEEIFLFNVDQDRGFPDADLPGDLRYSFQNGLELLRYGREDPDEPLAAPLGGTGRGGPGEVASFVGTTLSQIQADSGGLQDRLFPTPAPNELWGACSAGGSGATSCSVSCPLPGSEDLGCSVTCGFGYFACCQCLGPQPFCQCQDVVGPECI